MMQLVVDNTKPPERMESDFTLTVPAKVWGQILADYFWKNNTYLTERPFCESRVDAEGNVVLSFLKEHPNGEKSSA